MRGQPASSTLPGPPLGLLQASCSCSGGLCPLVQGREVGRLFCSRATGLLFGLNDTGLDFCPLIPWGLTTPDLIPLGPWLSKSKSCRQVRELVPLRPVVQLAWSLLPEDAGSGSTLGALLLSPPHNPLPCCLCVSFLCPFSSLVLSQLWLRNVIAGKSLTAKEVKLCME